MTRTQKLTAVDLIEAIRQGKDEETVRMYANRLALVIGLDPVEEDEDEEALGR